LPQCETACPTTISATSPTDFFLSSASATEEMILYDYHISTTNYYISGAIGSVGMIGYYDSGTFKYKVFSQTTTIKAITNVDTSIVGVGTDSSTYPNVILIIIPDQSTLTNYKISTFSMTSSSSVWSLHH
jgi:hypothetical protein